MTNPFDSPDVEVGGSLGEARWEDPPPCQSCGSPKVQYDLALGWCCAACGRTDADE